MRLTKTFARDISTSALAVALISGVAPSMAQAQDAVSDGEPGSDDVIIVSGIRGAIDMSVEQKRENTSIVEVISAEEIGKLPDQSIAESLSRLPGLATQRLDGRANVVSIRGLAPDFTTTLLNGREQVSASNNRGVELDQYPSELLNGAMVYKTPDAKLIGQALGGTIDMKSIRPLAYGKRAIVLGVRGEMNDMSKLNPDISRYGYRANISYVDQNADGTLGWAIGYARMHSPMQEKRWQAWGYPTIGACDGRYTEVVATGGTTCDGEQRAPLAGYEDAIGKQVIGGAKPYVKSNKLKRDGVMAVLEFEPSDKFHTTLDGYWSKFKEDQRLRGIELPTEWGGHTLQPGYTVEDGLITSGEYAGVEAVMRNDVVHRNSEIWAGGWNTQFAANETLTFELDLSYSHLKKTEENLEIYLGTARGGGTGATDDLGFTMPASGGVITFDPTIDYSDPALFTITDPRGWNSCGGRAANCQDGFVNRPRIKDRLGAIRLQATQALEGPFQSITVGANYSDRRKRLADEGFVLTSTNYPANTPVPSDYLYNPVSLGFIGIPGMVAFDSWRYYKDGNYDLTSEGLWEPSRWTRSYDVKEKVLTGYLQADFNTGPVRGNLGVQIVYTDQKADGYGARSVTDEDGITTVVLNDITDGDKYTNVLPSLNMTFEFAPDSYIRVGAARMLARARMDQMNPGAGYGFDASKNVVGASITNSPWSGTVGNAKLRPLLANTLDVAVEKYFGRGAYVSLGGFYKYMENWIYRQRTAFDFTGYPTPGNVTPTYNFGIVEQWRNGRGGRIHGAEAAFSMPFSTFSESLDGFGVLGSASYTKSKVREGSADPISMPGLSKWVINGTAYFEKSGFQIRGSGRYRSKFLAEVAGLSLARDRYMAKSEFVVDAQIGYTFQDGALEGLGFLLQGFNLTNEPFTTYFNDDPRQVRDYQDYGRNFMAGVTYKF